jgi:SAM-dependent methyltransferase
VADPRSYDPALYEMMHRGTPGDAAFYARRLAGARRVLELGCGYGRMLSALASALSETELTGLELHPGLLERARARLPERVRLLEGDMRALPPELPPQDAIIAPYSTLWCLPSDADALSCFRSVWARLAPGGRFLFDAYGADLFHEAEAEDEDDGPRFVADLHAEGRALRVFERALWRPAERAFTVRYEHVPLDGGAPLEGTIEHHYILAEPLRALLTVAGFDEVRLFAGFGGTPWHPDAEHVVGEARRGVAPE